MQLRKFESGAVRDADADDTRYDLVSTEGMRRLAGTYAEGAKKYDDHNWRKGMPFSATANHAIRHVYKWLAGLTDEDHLAHAAWGLFALMEFEKTHPELDDRYFKPKTIDGSSARYDAERAAGIEPGSLSKLPRNWHPVWNWDGQGSDCDRRSCDSDEHYEPLEPGAVKSFTEEGMTA
jgi:hypothetical protein